MQPGVACARASELPLVIVASEAWEEATRIAPDTCSTRLQRCRDAQGVA